MGLYGLPFSLSFALLSPHTPFFFSFYFFFFKSHIIRSICVYFKATLHIVGIFVWAIVD